MRTRGVRQPPTTIPSTDHKQQARQTQEQFHRDTYILVPPLGLVFTLSLACSAADRVPNGYGQRALFPQPPRHNATSMNPTDFP